jgi:CheY-like chemotaxis protein
MRNNGMSQLLQGTRILVVEDEPDSMEVAIILLEMYGAVVYAAGNGREGLEQARKYHPTFIISDLSMPEMSGWEMVHQLKDDRSTTEIPVIALTAHAMTGDRERALAAGFHNYLSKPLRPETFVQELVKLVADTPEIAQQLSEEG